VPPLPPLDLGRIGLSPTRHESNSRPGGGSERSCTTTRAGWLPSRFRRAPECTRQAAGGDGTGRVGGWSRSGGPRSSALGATAHARARALKARWGAMSARPSATARAGARTPPSASSTNTSQQEDPIGLHAHAGHPQTLPAQRTGGRADTRHRRRLPATAACPGGTRIARLRQAGAHDRTRAQPESRARAAVRSEDGSRGKPVLASRPLSLPGSQAFRRLAAGHARRSNPGWARSRCAAT
jgi:hypothetical protein